jgi:hypothetical protein
MPDGMNVKSGISKLGVYEIDQEDYHRDPVVVPSLSCSIARMLIRKTPRHAWQAHARFGSVGITPTKVMDDGSAVHAMMSGQSHLIQVIATTYGPKTKRKELIGLPVREYQSDASKEERDEIREAGRIPVLAHRLPQLQQCYREALEQLEEADDGAVFLSPGRSEIMAVSQEDDVWFRVLVDRLPDDRQLAPGDLKCTELSAAPGGWERRLQTEYAFQAAFYKRVLHKAEGFERPTMRFGVIELDPPHGTVIMAAAPTLTTIAEMEVELAVQRWRNCMRKGLWPRYPKHTAWIEATPWQVTEAYAAADREEIINKYAA